MNRTHQQLCPGRRDYKFSTTNLFIKSKVYANYICLYHTRSVNLNFNWFDIIEKLNLFIQAIRNLKVFTTWIYPKTAELKLFNTHGLTPRNRADA